MRHTSPIPPNSFSSPTSTALSVAFPTCARADSPFSDSAPTCLSSLRLSPIELPVFFPFAHRRPSSPAPIDCHQSHPASPLALPVSSRPSPMLLLLGASPILSCGFSRLDGALRPGYRALRSGVPTPMKLSYLLACRRSGRGYFCWISPVFPARFDLHRVSPLCPHDDARHATGEKPVRRLFRVPTTTPVLRLLRHLSCHLVNLISCRQRKWELPGRVPRWKLFAFDQRLRRGATATTCGAFSMTKTRASNL
ncbi:hypothetical protein LX32DRAFT_633993 [Colletotrichum zoysiae]|uniref:Uncharacterized protein n=1 Tax=Colletotrichum zoysiae TaxID=1216348 RepID=A0AAD9HVP6_9PEZI|nr:hypothetical protein LX32DRAFT_633993 [Colletotrichum zoysiae]